MELKWPNMRLLKLSCGRKTIIDDEDYINLSNIGWFIQNRCGNDYIFGNVLINGKRKCVQLHRYILKVNGFDNCVDHRNGNTLDNRKSNLRSCKRGENNRNQRLRATNKTGFKGVCKSNLKNKYRATIRKNGKQTHIGYFRTPKEAALAYDREAKMSFGEFARLNFPEKK